MCKRFSLFNHEKAQYEAPRRIRCTRRVPHLGELDVFIVLPFRRISKLRGISGTQNSDSFRLHQICRAWVSPRSPNCLVASGQWRAARSKQDVLQTQSPNRAAARTFAFAASSSRFLGSAFVSSEWRKRLETAVISSIAARNAASFAFAGLLKPLIFLTNCNEAARTSSDVTGGSKLKSVLIFLHIPITSTRFDQTLCVFPFDGGDSAFVARCNWDLFSCSSCRLCGLGRSAALARITRPG